MFFFIGGVSGRQKEIGSVHNLICSCCGRLTRFIVYKQYSCFHLFFIPLFRWNITYLARSACCDGWFSVPFEKGAAFEKDPGAPLTAEDLTPLSSSFSPSPRCPACGRTVQGDFSYCPFCGKPL